ncbi:2,4-dienoyl-CoA reductase-like NADH-dependent reductase (Old Yellow Enzyme family) [Raoultella ornithinolytica]|uniref:2,4-dienoyl-CoA reductase-like NADH-dependent reductase (Old Yellow Enzyme family) n=1 Tax=Raoultella ornithinolytica TaxID=54291 RepID=A0ABD7QQ64_RAOOR|nr:2,4-dienoyl-CoA reductase-like NADH-dependent reductase (Old Yellow Enzyme family) [Raoultella ornithinolytica]
MKNALFEPFDLAGTPLHNRVVMAPMTRSRAPFDVADTMTALYYTQRATAGLIVTEGTPVSREGQGYLFNPGIFNEEQIAGWKLTTDSVHSVGGRIFAQLWHVGRLSHPSIQENGKLPVSPSSKKAEGAKAFGYDENGQPALIDTPAPRPLKTDEIPRLVEDFAKAAENAIAAGFDGIEIHAANGYLFEQFLNPNVNDRTDKYAADTLSNRLRFTLEVIDAVISRIGANRVGIRLSPYGQIFDMPEYPEIDETYEALAAEIGKRRLAYLHLMNQSGFSRADGKVEGNTVNGFFKLMSAMKSQLKSTVLILAGGMTHDQALAMIERCEIDLAAFGANYISNPDLVARMQNGLPLSEPNRETFYGGNAKGYIDYPPYLA